MKIILVSGTSNSQVQEMVWSLWKKVPKGDLRASPFWVTATFSLFCKGNWGQLPYLFHRSPLPTTNIISSQETNKMQKELAQRSTNCCHETLYQTAFSHHLPNERPQTPGQGNSAAYTSSPPHVARHHTRVLLCRYPNTRISINSAITLPSSSVLGSTGASLNEHL